METCLEGGGEANISTNTYVVWMNNCAVLNMECIRLVAFSRKSCLEYRVSSRAHYSEFAVGYYTLPFTDATDRNAMLLSYLHCMFVVSL